MTTEDIIVHLFCLVDDRLGAQHKEPLAKLYPSEIVTIGVLFALKGVSFRAFERWLRRDWNALFGGLPERTRLLRLLRQYEHLPATLRTLLSPSASGHSQPPALSRWLSTPAGPCTKWSVAAPAVCASICVRPGCRSSRYCVTTVPTVWRMRLPTWKPRFWWHNSTLKHSMYGSS